MKKDTLDQEILDVIEFEIKHSMYYVEFPDDVQDGVWKDGAGNYHFMRDMGLDHLKASATRVERDIRRLTASGRPQEVLDVLLPRANKVLTRLKVAFSQKAQI